MGQTEEPGGAARVAGGKQDPEKKALCNNKAAELFEKLLNYDPDQQKEMFLYRQ